MYRVGGCVWGAGEMSKFSLKQFSRFSWLQDHSPWGKSPVKNLRMVLPQYGLSYWASVSFLGSCRWLWLKCFDNLFILLGTHDVCKESWALWVLIWDLFSAPNLLWVPTKSLTLCSYGRLQHSLILIAHIFCLTASFSSLIITLLDGNFHNCFLSTSMPSQDLCLKLWVFNKNHLEKEMHVETLKQIVTLLFVLSPKEQKEKNLLKFFSDVRERVKESKTHIWPSFSSEHFA